MSTNRRDFIKLSATTLITTSTLGVFTYGSIHETTSSLTFEKVVPVMCGACGAGCGLLYIERGGRRYLLPNSGHPSPGLCARAASALQMWNHPLRLKRPLKRVESGFVEVDWDTALNEIAAKLKDIVSKYGPESVVITRHDVHSWFLPLFAALIGTPNLIGHEGTCHSASTAARRAVLGASGPPTVDPDYGNVKYLVLLGRVLDAAMGHVRSLAKARERGAKIVVIDPRAPNIAFGAVEWVPIIPGTDAVFLASMAYVIISKKLYDVEFLKFYTNAPMLIKPDGKPLGGKEIGVEADYVVWDNATQALAPLGKAKDPALELTDEVRQRLGGAKTVFELFRERVSKYPPEKASEITGVSAEIITKIAEEFAKNKGVIEDGWYTSRNGNEFDTYRLVLILNALVGNIDKQGGLCFQESAKYPNVCDPVGPDIVTVTGMKIPRPTAKRIDTSKYPLAVSTFNAVYDAILAGENIKALFIVGTAPLQRDTNYQRAVEALKKLELVVAIDIFPHDHVDYAHYILPDLMFLEREEVAVVKWTLHAAIQMSHKALDPPPGVDARHAPWILMEIVRRAFPERAKLVGYDERYADPHAFEEWERQLVEAALKKVADAFKMPLDEIKRQLEEKGFVVLKRKEYGVRPYKTKLGTPTGLVEIYSLTALKYGLDPLPDYRPPLYTPPKAPNEFYLVNGKDQVVSAHFAFTPNARFLADRSVWMNPKDAERLGIRDGDVVELEGIDTGFKAVARVKVTNRVREGVLFTYSFIGGRRSGFINGDFAWLREGVNPQWFATGKIEPVVGSAPTNATVRVRRL
ncbi:molybdopterin oxidoreductase [Pyrobaculum islandicum DSM 4184]|uniref:Molybdopterin oxidoreductase n=1 Tax=Pyrobaculum islandicum (strain DSM 4184 / JCM 9189 / GEO3) TaxID=384616 RepID=A1RQW2_PYRIL|nr:molybdopterin-dependent oxidoreductase [Pyrobaculum islandicum]ABL87344.1 molybdopterin oxidoreductase [Pyrobaculum islandicum DSM 4184]